ncbi:MAG: LysM domain-containing protein [bacterium]|nr:LysM domain-containing protein [bacterium]
MSRRDIVVTVVAGHACVLGLAVLFGGCARQRRDVKLTAAAPVGEIRAPEGEPEAILEPKGLAEETDLLVSRAPEIIPAAPPPAAAPEPAPAAVAREERAPVVPEIRPPAEAPAAGPAVAARTHRVAPGESLWKIGRMYGISVAALARANDIPPDSRLRVGQLLSLPEGAAVRDEAPPREAPPTAPEAGTRHLVRKGESLWMIARQHRVSLARLIEANRIEDPSKIREGQILVIPR